MTRGGGVSGTCDSFLCLATAQKQKNQNQGNNEIGLQFYIQNATCFNALEHMQKEIVSLSSLCSLKQSSHFDREGGKTVWYLEDQKLLVQKKQNKAVSPVDALGAAKSCRTSRFSSHSLAKVPLYILPSL